ncbi:hypothetical protein HNR42_001418 [Deinobacterium chartae]|uniref:SbsA Ig-like domain-containing protein n=1 Tax=Deinobacterium chartae TaxID=521158 RepID=A0A841I234_9DEIO|nr:Ig-like domain-containing protein [Deinobacterium chartae]MBB6097995.1 hypothetical protein [Deinobacterium chartae]
MRKYLLTAALGLSALLAGCDPEGNNQPKDTTSPHVVSVSPTPGSKGVRADTPIRFTFSEPMDRAATEAAYASQRSGITPQEVTFEWSNNDQTLTITPKKALEYAVGDDLNTPRSEYDFALTQGARDQSGNTLPESFVSNFRTALKYIKRQVSQAKLDGSVRFSDQDTVILQGNSVAVGDIANDIAQMGFYTFGVNELPENAEVLAATFRVYQGASFGQPFEGGAKVHLEHVTYGEELDASDRDLLPKADLGVISSSSTQGLRSKDVTDAYREAAQNGENFGLVQFRLVRNPLVIADGGIDAVIFSTGEDPQNPAVLEVTALID